MHLSPKINAVLTGAASEIEQRLAVHISEVAQDEAIFGRGARFKVIAHPNALDVDGLGPPIMKVTLSLK